MANIGTKFISIVFALMLVLSMGVSVHAAGEAEQQQQPGVEREMDQERQPGVERDMDREMEMDRDTDQRIQDLERRVQELERELDMEEDNDNGWFN